VFISLKRKHSSLLQIFRSVKFFIKLNLQASNRYPKLWLFTEAESFGSPTANDNCSSCQINFGETDLNSDMDNIKILSPCRIEPGQIYVYKDTTQEQIL
jgi:hypothetical protein